MNMKKIIGLFVMFLVVFLPLASLDVTAYQQQYNTQLYGSQTFGNYNSQNYYATGAGYGDNWQNQESVGNKLERWSYGIGANDYLYGEAIDLGEAIIVNVGDYEPKMVREAMLEQQAVPVFVYLSGTNVQSISSMITGEKNQPDLFSGLSDVPPISHVEVDWDNDNPFIKLIDHIPPKGKAYSMDNLGMLVIYLEKLDGGDALPEETVEEIPGVKSSNSALKEMLSANLIKANITTTIYFDFAQEGYMNIGPQSLILKVDADEDSFLEQSNHDEYSFMGGRGFIRAETINPGEGSAPGSATFRVYDKDMRLTAHLASGEDTRRYDPIDSFPSTVGGRVRLNEGEMQTNIPFDDKGNPLEDYISIKLDSVVGAENRTFIELKWGNKVEQRVLTKGKALFSGSMWSVADMKVAEVTIAAEKSRILTQMSITGSPQLFKHSLSLTNGHQVKTVSKYVVGDLLGGNFPDDIQPGTVESLELKYCGGAIQAGTTTDFFTGISTPISSTGAGYACQAVANLREVIKNYPSSNTIDSAYLSLAGIYKDYLIDYPACHITSWTPGPTSVPIYSNDAQCQLFKRDMEKLAYYYLTKSPGASERLKHEFLQNMRSVGGDFQLPYEGISISLKYVDIIDEKEMGKFSYKIANSAEIKDVKIGDPLKGSNGAPLEGTEKSGASGTRKFNWKVDRIDPGRVRLVKQYVGTNSLGGTTTLRLGSLNNLVVSDVFDGRTSYETQQVEITGIDTDTMAYVTIIPGSGQGKSTSNFNVYIPIEPRPFQLTPDQIKSQIKTTREIAESLEDTVMKLYGVVKAWKKVCILTFGWLTAKNILFGGGAAKVLARQQVASYYKQDVCYQNVGFNKEYKTMDECLYANSDNIERMVEVEKNAYEYVDKTAGSKTADQIIAEGGDGEKFLVAGGTIDQYRDYLKFKHLNDSVGNNADYDQYMGQYKEFGGVATSYNKKVDSYDAAKYWYDQTYDTWSDNKKTSFKKGISASDDTEVLERIMASAAVHDVGYIGSHNLESVELISYSQDNKGASAFVPAVDSTGKMVDLKPVELVRLTQVGYEIEEIHGGNVANFITRIDSELTQAGKTSGDDSVRAEYIKQKYKHVYATDTQGNDIFVENIPANLQSLSAAGVPITSPTTTAKYYTSSVTNQDGRQLNARYSPRQTMVAEYGDGGNIYCAPIDNGNYIFVLDRYQNTGAPKSFQIRNVGQNGLIECQGGGDDELILDNSALAFNQKERLKYLNLFNKYDICKKSGDKANKAPIGSIQTVVCSNEGQQLAADLTAPKCIDSMDPSDCQILFNACDPVMCPTSRCNLGGRYHVDNVIASGLIGSAVLCSNNLDNGVYMPVCLTGILASLNNIKSILEGYAECLEINLESNENVGICDEIRSIGFCELIWREGMNLVKMRGGLIDWVADGLFGENQGGGEYLSFRNTLDNAEDSFDFFTNDYKNTFLGYYQGKSSDEIGSQICQMQIRGKMPSFGEFLDKLAEPEDPPQFTAFFDSAPYMEQAGQAPGVPGAGYGVKELEQYRVFYHLYAGSGFTTQEDPLSEFTVGETSFNGASVTYMVYLKGPGVSPMYVTLPSNNAVENIVGGNFGQNRNTVQRGRSTQQTIHKIGPKGYNEICVNINGYEECGFGKVTSSFGVNYVNDRMVENDAQTQITSAAECVPDVSSATLALGSLGGAAITTPEQYGMLSTGIVRICNPTMPTPEAGRWAVVGVCGEDESGIDRGSCWLDRSSVRIQDAQGSLQTQQALSALSQQYGVGGNFQLMDDTQARSMMNLLNQQRDRIIQEIAQQVINGHRTSTSSMSARLTGGASP
jgi:hypothetical protein